VRCVTVLRHKRCRKVLRFYKLRPSGLRV